MIKDTCRSFSCSNCLMVAITTGPSSAGEGSGEHLQPNLWQGDRSHDRGGLMSRAWSTVNRPLCWGLYMHVCSNYAQYCRCWYHVVPTPVCPSPSLATSSRVMRWDSSEWLYVLLLILSIPHKFYGYTFAPIPSPPRDWRAWTTMCGKLKLLTRAILACAMITCDCMHTLDDSTKVYLLYWHTGLSLQLWQLRPKPSTSAKWAITNYSYTIPPL